MKKKNVSLARQVLDPSVSIEDLGRRMAEGDAHALKKLLNIMDNPASLDEDAKEAFEHFDDAATLYAMNLKKGGDDEWAMFRVVCSYADQVEEQASKLEEAKCSTNRFEKEIEVLRVIAKTAKSEQMRSKADCTLSVYADLETSNRYRIQSTEEEKEYAELLLATAKSKLTDSRFTSLSEDELNELIDSVRFDLAQMEKEMDDHTDDHDDCDECEEGSA